MVRFCEECGAKLSPQARFCEECGTAVDADIAFDDKGAKGLADAPLDEPFLNTDWQAAWGLCAEKSSDAALGLIVTRERALLQQIKADRSDYRNLLRGYISKAVQRGVCFHYLNLDSCPLSDGEGDVASVVKALRSIVEIARPKYLLILGNEEIIDVARFDNETGDGDEQVESDLPYATLCTDSPWKVRDFDYDANLRVGRIPTYQGETFEKFAVYFRTAEDSVDKFGRIVPYGLSALVWEVESNAEFRAISMRPVDVSPNVTKSNVKARMGSEANILFFNLHGSCRTGYWYGQDGGSYPEAVAPEVLATLQRPHFIGVEACYGARYLNGLMPKDSIVLTALENHCLAFLGSSRIAFGSSKPSGSCADIVIGNFIKYLDEGYSAGDAHAEGLKMLCADTDSMDDSDIKTLAEFALYGDPSACIGRSRYSSGLKRFKRHEEVAKGMSVPMPDIHRAVHMALAQVDAKIESIVDDFARRELLSDMSAEAVVEMEQKVYKMSNGLNQKIFRSDTGVVTRVAKVYFDDNGKIHKAITSK